MININANNRCYYFYLNCVDGYKYTVLNDTQQAATRKDDTRDVSELKSIRVTGSHYTEKFVFIILRLVTAL
jgi:hypothetical protein